VPDILVVPVIPKDRYICMYITKKVWDVDFHLIEAYPLDFLKYVVQHVWERLRIT